MCTTEQTSIDYNALNARNERFAACEQLCIGVTTEQIRQLVAAGGIQELQRLAALRVADEVADRAAAFGFGPGTLEAKAVVERATDFGYGPSDDVRDEARP
jgi:hypothetical protein